MVEHKIDRTNWPSGPWDNEGDRYEWRSDDLACLVVRNNFGAWCGYVGVPPGHPWYDRSYNSIGAEVHGGLNYGAPCREDSPICHVPRPGETEELFWLGFDCAHCDDLAPGELRVSYSPQTARRIKTYRDLAYVRAEVENLAAQARRAAVATP